MNFLIAGILALTMGFLFIQCPAFFQRGIWQKISIAQRVLSPESYKRHMRIRGMMLTTAGLLLCVSGVMQLLRH